MQKELKTSIPVSVIGGSGYTGAELLRLIAHHPNFELIEIVANKNAGKRVEEVFPHLRNLKLPKFIAFESLCFLKVKLIFCALPHSTSQEIIKKIPQGIKIIDLSADFRLDNVEEYKKWYKTEHIAPELQKKAVYGLSEFYREEIRESSLVACTGCNAAASLFPILPLLKKKIIDIDHISINLGAGVSGAGRSPKENILHAEVSEGVKPYNAGGHRHIAELDQEFFKACGKNVDITFVPHLLPQNRGVIVTIPLNYKAQIIHDALNKYYKNDNFVIILPLGSIPATQHVRGSNFCHIGVVQDNNNERSILFSVLDNLVKGSSGQAIQNANIIFGLCEESGLLESPIFP
jgi:N-acetyl-gamma-glutamyl-phosphate reductase